MKKNGKKESGKMESKLKKHEKSTDNNEVDSLYI